MCDVFFLPFLIRNNFYWDFAISMAIIEPSGDRGTSSRYQSRRWHREWMERLVTRSFRSVSLILHAFLILDIDLRRGVAFLRNVDSSYATVRAKLFFPRWIAGKSQRSRNRAITSLVPLDPRSRNRVIRVIDEHPRFEWKFPNGERVPAIERGRNEAALRVAD